MEIQFKTDDDLLKYKGQTIGVVTESYFSNYGPMFGLLVGKLIDIDLVNVRNFPSYDDYYRVGIGGNITTLDVIKKAFTDPSEAFAYYEYLSGK